MELVPSNEFEKINREQTIGECRGYRHLRKLTTARQQELKELLENENPNNPSDAKTTNPYI